MTTTDQPSVSLQLSAGAGWVARRSDAVLFVAAGGDRTLIDAFTGAATSTEAADAVCATTIGASDALAGFAVVHWGDRTRLIVYGDLSLRTNQASAPNLSGLGSSTWVEHTLLGTSDEVRIMLGGDEPDAATDLQRGIALAGGFALCLLIDVQPSVQEPESSSDVSDSLFQAGDDGDVPTMRTHRPGPETNVTDLFSASTPTSTLSVVLDDGTVIAVDRGLLIGRKPDPARDASLTGMEPFVIDDPKLSRNHMVVNHAGNSVTITDCGSLNGTVLISKPGAVPVHLERGVPVTLGSQSILYFGDQIIRLVP